MALSSRFIRSSISPLVSRSLTGLAEIREAGSPNHKRLVLKSMVCRYRINFDSFYKIEEANSTMLSQENRGEVLMSVDRQERMCRVCLYTSRYLSLCRYTSQHRSNINTISITLRRPVVELWQMSWRSLIPTDLLSFVVTDKGYGQCVYPTVSPIARTKAIRGHLCFFLFLVSLFSCIHATGLWRSVATGSVGCSGGKALSKSEVGGMLGSPLIHSKGLIIGLPHKMHHYLRIKEVYLILSCFYLLS